MTFSRPTEICCHGLRFRRRHSAFSYRQSNTKQWPTDRPTPNNHWRYAGESLRDYVALYYASTRPSANKQRKVCKTSLWPRIIQPRSLVCAICKQANIQLDRIRVFILHSFVLHGPSSRTHNSLLQMENRREPLERSKNLVTSA